MRGIVLWAIIAALAAYAWRDWFVSACALVVLATFMKHSDMPRTVADISGTNPWNLLLAMVIVAWAATRRRSPAAGPCPRYVMAVFLLYAAILIAAFLRGVTDLGGMRNYVAEGAEVTPGGFTVEYLLNPVKYVVLAALVFDGARASRRNMLLAYGAIIVQVLLFTFMTLRYIPLTALLEPVTERGTSAYRNRFQRDIGFHANDIALMLVAGFWAIVASAPLLRAWRWWWKAAAIVGGTLTALATLMTNSRGGYMALMGVGLLFGMLRYRWLLVALPVAMGIALLVFPNVADRVGFGFGTVDVSGERTEDWAAISAGRTTDLWPLTIEEIINAPAIGQGRMTIFRSSLRQRIEAFAGGGCPSHPHNAYLEMLLDSGAIGLVVTLLLFVGFPILAYRRLRSGDPLLTTVLHAGLAGAATILIMGISGQTFWPREGVDTILYLYALMMAGSVIRLPVGAAESARYAALPLRSAPLAQSAQAPPFQLKAGR